MWVILSLIPCTDSLRSFITLRMDFIEVSNPYLLIFDLVGSFAVLYLNYPLESFDWVWVSWLIFDFIFLSCSFIIVKKFEFMKPLILTVFMQKI